MAVATSLEEAFALLSLQRMQESQSKDLHDPKNYPEEIFIIGNWGITNQDTVFLGPINPTSQRVDFGTYQMYPYILRCLNGDESDSYIVKIKARDVTDSSGTVLWFCYTFELTLKKDVNFSTTRIYKGRGAFSMAYNRNVLVDYNFDEDSTTLYPKLFGGNNGGVPCRIYAEFSDKDSFGTWVLKIYVISTQFTEESGDKILVYESKVGLRGFGANDNVSPVEFAKNFDGILATTDDIASTQDRSAYLPCEIIMTGGTAGVVTDVQIRNKVSVDSAEQELRRGFPDDSSKTLYLRKYAFRDPNILYSYFFET